MECQRAFDQQTEALFDHLLAREHLSSSTWKERLWQLSAKIVETVNVDVQTRPKAINILDYVHIKKLHVTGEPSVEVRFVFTFLQCGKIAVNQRCCVLKCALRSRYAAIW